MPKIVNLFNFFLSLLIIIKSYVKICVSAYFEYFVILIRINFAILKKYLNNFEINIKVQLYCYFAFNMVVF